MLGVIFVFCSEGEQGEVFRIFFVIVRHLEAMFMPPVGRSGEPSAPGNGRSSSIPRSNIHGTWKQNHH
jgi:hypothetical protein